jgi:nucleoid DNA-binding protein
VDITAFIRELLFGHDCVIVPGFGGFIGNHTPARIDTESGTFYPPVKKISFNRNLNHNDGLLVGKISGSSGINYGDARRSVEEFVTGVRRKLDKGENVIFDHIGSFVNNNEGNVQFEPDRNANYLLDSYCLESFQCLPLEGYDVRSRVISRTSKDPVKQASVRRILWRAAVVIPLLAILVAVPLKTDLFKARVESTTLNPLVTAEFEQNKKAVDGDIKDDPSKISDNVTQSSAATTSEAVATSGDSFFLITGSFKSEENAVSQVNLLKAEGFEPEIVKAPNGFFRVIAMTCSDNNTALIKKDSISKKFPGTWISGKK